MLSCTHPACAGLIDLRHASRLIMMVVRQERTFCQRAFCITHSDVLLDSLYVLPLHRAEAIAVTRSAPAASDASVVCQRLKYLM